MNTNKFRTKMEIETQKGKKIYTKMTQYTKIEHIVELHTK